MHRVAILALDSVIAFDLGIACEVFARAQLPDGTAAYSVLVCGVCGSVQTSAFELRPPGRLRDMATADTVVVPGIEDIEGPIAPQVIASLQAAWDRGARIVSICTGAFVLGATGLLDGRRATTHWIASDDLARRHPLAIVEPNVLFVDEGRLVTSAGASAGLDMCLHLVRRDHGQAVAAHAARLAVAPLNRDGGQAQFIRQAPSVRGSSLSGTLDWMLASLEQPLDVAAMAARAGMSERTFARRFLEQTGTTPLQWLLTARVRRAQELLEGTAMTTDEVAEHSGFESSVTFRSRFQRTVGLSPAIYRRRFRGKAALVVDHLPAGGPIAL